MNDWEERCRRTAAALLKAADDVSDLDTKANYLKMAHRWLERSVGLNPLDLIEAARTKH